MEARIERVASPGDAGAPEGNAWIVGDDDEVIVVDPGRDAKAVLAAVGDREILAVICTHGHASHVAAASGVASRDETPVALHPRDRLLWRESHRDGDPEIEMEDGGIFEVADVSLEVIHAPGHSPGSVCLYSEELEAVFAGDTLIDQRPGSARWRVPGLPRSAQRDWRAPADPARADPGPAWARGGDHCVGGPEALRLLGDRRPRPGFPVRGPGLSGCAAKSSSGWTGCPAACTRAPRPG